MRFFLEFVSCCGSPTWSAPEPYVSTEEEERWLVPAPSAVAATSRLVYRKKQRKSGAPDWKPSLGAIAEDIEVPPRKSLSGAGGSVGKNMKKRPVHGAAARVYRRSYSDGQYGSSSMPMIMPGFSPTPFMF